MFQKPATENFWPIRPQPMGDETFGSWFSRLAWANGVTATELHAISLPGARMHRRDLDRLAEAELLENVSQHTGASVEDLANRTFRYWSGRLFESDDHRTKLIWLTPAGQIETKKCFGQQLCPECLSEHREPYLIQHWRLGFVTSCDVHNVLLVDRCPRCRSPIQPLYHSSPYSTVSDCWNCGFDFREATIEETPPFSHQKDLVQIAERGWTYLGDEHFLYSISFFRLLWTIYRLLATGRFAFSLREKADKKVPPSSIPTIKEIERLNPRCRRVLLGMAMALLEDWPCRFVDACHEVGISTRVLIKDPAQVPHALWDVARTQLLEPSIRVSQAEILAAKRFLEKRGAIATHRNLSEILGTKFKTHRRLASPAKESCPWGEHRYWKLDGVSAAVRANARKAAHHEGERIGPWVDKVLRDALRRKGFE